MLTNQQYSLPINATVSIGTIGKPFATYEIQLEGLFGESSWIILKRYSDILELRNRLLVLLDTCKLPCCFILRSYLLHNFPRKRFFGSNKYKTVKMRSLYLEKIIQVLLNPRKIVSMACPKLATVIPTLLFPFLEISEPADRAALLKLYRTSGVGAPRSYRSVANAATTDSFDSDTTALNGLARRISEEKSLCVICLDPIHHTKEKVVFLLCCHEYHLGCLLKWVRTHSVCPLCRCKITTKYKSLLHRQRLVSWCNEVAVIPPDQLDSDDVQPNIQEIQPEDD